MLVIILIYHLKFSFIRNSHLCMTWLCLMRLDNLFIICLHYSQSHNFLSKSITFVFLFFFLYQQKLYILNWFFKNSSLGQFKSSCFLILTCWYKILKRIITFFNSITTFLFSMSVCLSTTCLITNGWTFIIAIFILWNILFIH